MTSRIAILKAEIEEREQEIAHILQEEEAEAARIKVEAARIKEEEASKAREALAHAKTAWITEEPHKKRISLIDALNIAIDTGEDYIFAVNSVKRAEAKLAEYDGFATMGAYEAREVLEDEIANSVDAQRKCYPSIHNVLVAMRESERERSRYLERVGLDLATLKAVIGC
jgi:hypothetical protein